MRPILFLTILSSLVVCGGRADAAPFPTRAVRMIVAYAPGSAPDIACRIVADRMARGLGQQVVVDNRPGASNLIAAQAVAHAPADGYTLFFTAAAALVTNRLTFKSLPYDPEHDFTPVGLVGRTTFMILVNPAVSAKTLPQLMALDKAHPGSLSFASDGPTTISGMIGEWLNDLGGLHLVQVPYPNMPQGIQDALAGRIQIIMLAMTVATPLAQDGRLRPIAVSTAHRLPTFPDVPPVADTFPGFDLGGWYGVVAPRGTPTAVVRQLNRQLDAALTDPVVRGKLENGGLLVGNPGTPETFGTFLQEDRARWAEIVHKIGIKPK
jgi:tripartite-type tricarboxylate transporter receptor subunit TctC